MKALIAAAALLAHQDYSIADARWSSQEWPDHYSARVSLEKGGAMVVSCTPRLGDGPVIELRHPDLPPFWSIQDGRLSVTIRSIDRSAVTTRWDLLGETAYATRSVPRIVLREMPAQGFLTIRIARPGNSEAAITVPARDARPHIERVYEHCGLLSPFAANPPVTDRWIIDRSEGRAVTAEAVSFTDDRLTVRCINGAIAVRVRSPRFDADGTPEEFEMRTHLPGFPFGAWLTWTRDGDEAAPPSGTDLLLAQLFAEQLNFEADKDIVSLKTSVDPRQVGMVFTLNEAWGAIDHVLASCGVKRG